MKRKRIKKTIAVFVGSSQQLVGDKKTNWQVKENTTNTTFDLNKTNKYE